MTSPTNYNAIAPNYSGRYAQNPLAGVARELRRLLDQTHAQTVLEVGCGTGRWVGEFGPGARQMVGLDYSLGMLRQARAEVGAARWVNGDANHLPFPAGHFDAVLSINALHHYRDQRAFITEARRLARHCQSRPAHRPHPLVFV